MTFKNILLAFSSFLFNLSFQSMNSIILILKSNLKILYRHYRLYQNKIKFFNLMATCKLKTLQFFVQKAFKKKCESLLYFRIRRKKSIAEFFRNLLDVSLINSDVLNAALFGASDRFSRERRVAARSASRRRGVTFRRPSHNAHMHPFGRSRTHVLHTYATRTHTRAPRCSNHLWISWS